MLAATDSLAVLPIGGQARIAQLCATGTLRRRLLDLGLIPGTRIDCLGQSPAGDPASYLVRGTVIALRRRDAAAIRLEQPTD